MTRHNDIDRGKTLVWRNGVVLCWPGDALGEVSKTKLQGRDAFFVRTSGRDRKGLMTVILKTFRELHDEYRGIKSDEKVPCPCDGCQLKKNKPHYFDFENLKNRLEKGRRTVECDKSLEEMDLLKLLENLFVFEKMQAGQPLFLKNDLGKNRKTENQKPTRDLKIFLASSAELREDRDAFELYFRQQNDRLRAEKGIYLKMVRWENFLDAMSETRLQDEYNREIYGCDIFVSLFFTKTGKFTEEEFDVAHRQFLETKKPQIFTFFKNGEVKMGSLTEQVKTLLDFKDKLKNLGHFYTGYENIEDLKLRFRDQLDKLLANQKI